MDDNKTPIGMPVKKPVGKSKGDGESPPPPDTPGGSESNDNAKPSSPPPSSENKTDTPTPDAGGKPTPPPTPPPNAGSDKPPPPTKKGKGDSAPDLSETHARQLNSGGLTGEIGGESLADVMAGAGRSLTIMGAIAWAVGTILRKITK